jgi:hypothetical protein
LFSNAGGWVTCHRLGVALVSTMPVTFNASRQPTAEVYVPTDGLRSSIDMDDFAGGFATWSGTSFAAPILAGQLAQAGLDAGTMADPSPSAARTRNWAGLGELVGLQRPLPS